MTSPRYHLIKDSAEHSDSRTPDPAVLAYTELLESDKTLPEGTADGPAAVLRRLKMYRWALAKAEQERCCPFLPWRGPPEPWTSLIEGLEQQFALQARAWAEKVREEKTQSNLHQPACASAADKEASSTLQHRASIAGRSSQAASEAAQRAAAYSAAAASAASQAASHAHRAAEAASATVEALQTGHEAEVSKAESRLHAAEAAAREAAESAAKAAGMATAQQEVAQSQASVSEQAAVLTFHEAGL